MVPRARAGSRLRLSIVAASFPPTQDRRSYAAIVAWAPTPLWPRGSSDRSPSCSSSGSRRTSYATSSASGCRTEHAGQTTITLTGLHAHFGKGKEALVRISAQLQAWAARAAEQFNPTTVWDFVCDHLKLIHAGCVAERNQHDLHCAWFGAVSSSSLRDGASRRARPSQNPSAPAAIL